MVVTEHRVDNKTCLGVAGGLTTMYHNVDASSEECS